VIPLFKDATPPPTSEVSSKFWQWGQGFVEAGVLNLAQLVDEIQEAETEEQLLDLVRQLKSEVATYPDA
jgi:hypothetical protein